MHTFLWPSGMLLLLLSVLQLAAQPGGLPSEQVEVIKSFDARLADAEKIAPGPARLGLDTNVVPQIYRVEARPSRLTYDPPRLRPLALRREPLPEQFRGFVKAGYGHPTSPFLQAGYHLKRDDLFEMRVGVFHHSANFPKVENQRFARTGVDLEGNYHLPDRFSLHGDIGFNQDLVSYYGYNAQDTSFSKEETKQRFNRFHLGGAIFNTHANNLGLDYRGEVRFYGLRDFYDARENGLDAELSLSKWFSDSHPLRVVIGNDLSAFRDTIAKTLNTFYVRPSFTYHGEAFRLKAGLNLVTRSEEFHLLPDLEALVSLAGNALAIYAGWRGDYHQNSFDHLSRYNPFIASQFDPRTSIYQDIYAGVKGAAKGWNYQGQVGLKRVNDMALFLPDSLDTRRFAVLYDTVRDFYISGGAGIELLPGLELSGTVLQHLFSLNQQEKAWHLPGLEMNAALRYLLLDKKLLLRGDAFIADGIPYRQADSNPGRLGGLLDLSFSGHYQIIRNLGAWLQINNLTNNKRERWQRYPTYGINVLAGIQFRF
jgi:hypothetical protein